MYDYKYSWNENEERGEKPLLSRNCKGNESQIKTTALYGWEGWQVDSPEPGDRSFQKNLDERSRK